MCQKKSTFGTIDVTNFSKVIPLHLITSQQSATYNACSFQGGKGAPDFQLAFASPPPTVEHGPARYWVQLMFSFDWGGGAL